MTGPRPCGMCSIVCWQCQNQFDRAKADWERQEAEVTALEIAFAEADDKERDGIAQRLQEATEVWWELGEAIDAMGEGRVRL